MITQQVERATQLWIVDFDGIAPVDSPASYIEVVDVPMRELRPLRAPLCQQEGIGNDLGVRVDDVCSSVGDSGGSVTVVAACRAAQFGLAVAERLASRTQRSVTVLLINPQRLSRSLIECTNGKFLDRLGVSVPAEGSATATELIESFARDGERALAGGMLLASSFVKQAGLRLTREFITKQADWSRFLRSSIALSDLSIYGPDAYGPHLDGSRVVTISPSGLVSRSVTAEIDNRVRFEFC